MQSVKAEGDGAEAYGPHCVDARDWRPTIDPDTSTLRADNDGEDDVPPVGIVEPLSVLMRSPVLQKFGPLIVAGNVEPDVGYGKLQHLATDCFKIVDSIPNVAPMTLRIERGLPTKTFSTDHEQNSWLKYSSPDMTCQVAVTLKKNPMEEPSTLDGWEVCIVQVFHDNVEVRNYGASKDPDSVDFTIHQCFHADGKHLSLPILDTVDCVCDRKDTDPAYSCTSSQAILEADMRAIMQNRMVFGRVSSADHPNSSARVLYHQSKDSSPYMRQFFKQNWKWLKAKTYYLNKIEKHSSIITYLTIYNTTSREIYTPMAAQWYLDCTIRRAKGTDNFEWYQTSKDQCVPKALTQSRPDDFISISPDILKQHSVRCLNHSGTCRGYATFNNSVYLVAADPTIKDPCQDAPRETAV